jgi:hypothetical protein
MRRVNDLVERLRQTGGQARIEMLERDNHIQQLQLDQRRTSAFLSAALMLVDGWRDSPPGCAKRW